MLNAAAVLALCAAVLQLGIGLLLVGLSRAPGWRAARVFALIALTASAYSAANMFFALPTFGDRAVLNASRVNFFAGSLHCAAWLPYTFGGPTASIRRLSAPIKALMAVLIGVGTFILLTGLHYVPGVWSDTSITWAGVSYHSPTLWPWAEWYGMVMLAALVLPFVEFVRRARAGVEGAATHLVGFSVFFVCSMVELLVANRVIDTFYMADIGFVAVVLPIAIGTVRRVVQDAGRLDALSRRLAGEVEERTEALDRAQIALLESERHASLGRLAAGVGHEINNPLTYLGLSLDAVESWSRDVVMPADVRDSLTHARDGTDRIRQVVDGLRNYTRATSGEGRVLRPDDLIASALRVASHQLHHVAQVNTEITVTLSVAGDEARLVQVLVNLLTNAAQAIAEAGLSNEERITIRSCMRGADTVAIEVIDSGPGIPEEHLRLLTQPYFTTRAETGGTGLGLYLARGIVEQHGGRLELESVVGTGTTARVVLPAVTETADETLQLPTDSLPTPFANRRPTVLIVDDEAMLARGLARALASYCEVVTATSAEEALVCVRSATPRIDAIVCDLMMPGISGMELADRLAVTDPSLRARTLFMTGGAVTPAAIEFLDRPDVRFIHKPIGAAQLAEELGQLLASHGEATQSQ